MKQFLIPLLLGALPAVARAQVPPATSLPPDTARVFKHELGLTASPQLDHFFTANRALPVGLLYKRHLNARSALRLRVVGQYANRDTTSEWLPYPLVKGTGHRTWASDVWLGYERRHPLGGRWQWGAGAELGLGYTYDNLRYSVFIPASNDYPSHTKTSLNKLRQWRVQGRPFVSVAYKLSSRLQFFAESAVRLTYAYNVRNYEGDDRFDDGAVASWVTPVKTTSDEGRLNWSPVQIIGFSVRL